MMLWVSLTCQKGYKSLMSPKKLTEEDKQEILKLYRQTPETTSTLAERYGVSSSTVSRFLKNYLSESEYEDLIQKKRLARTARSDEAVKQASLELYLSSGNAEDNNIPEANPTEPIPAETPDKTPQKKLDPVIISSPKAKTPVEKPIPVSKQKNESPEDEDEDEDEAIDNLAMMAVQEMLGEDIADEDDLEDEDEGDWEDEDDDDYSESLASPAEIQVLPLAEAAFPSTCYLVIDRAAELITRPLQDFAHLGNIPHEEGIQRTLPVFDNHRVARRFSKRSQRVIKVPDGGLLRKTCPHLEAKGITRILLDGRIYDLSHN